MRLITKQGLAVLLAAVMLLALAATAIAQAPSTLRLHVYAAQLRTAACQSDRHAGDQGYHGEAVAYRQAYMTVGGYAIPKQHLASFTQASECNHTAGPSRAQTPFAYQQWLKYDTGRTCRASGKVGFGPDGSQYWSGVMVGWQDVYNWAAQAYRSRLRQRHIHRHVDDAVTARSKACGY